MLYLESHVTISPVFDEIREQVREIAQRYGFKLAHLVLLKDRGPDIPSQRDTFMTGHSKEIDDLVKRTQLLTRELKVKGFKIWRYKIEACTFDSRQQGDFWEVMDPDAPVLPLIACDGCVRI